MQQEGVNLVAMTTHAYTGLRRVLAGSVAEHVLRTVNVSVLLLRPVTPPPAILQQVEVRSVANLELW